MRILFVADVFGPPGRRAIETELERLKDELSVDFTIVNGENVADGRGITPRLADKILSSGADVITLGNHVWARDEIRDYLATSERVIRPANLASGLPGRGLTVATAADGTPVAVCNLMGWLFLETPVTPFEVIDELVPEATEQAKVIVVDFHAEATSEKIALSRLLDGRVTAVIGTHTHVQTADARIQPGGTAAITDAGMTGPARLRDRRRGRPRDRTDEDRHARSLLAGEGRRSARRRDRRLRSGDRPRDRDYACAGRSRLTAAPSSPRQRAQTPPLRHVQPGVVSAGHATSMRHLAGRRGDDGEKRW